MHCNPELGMNEVKACSWQVDLLEKMGFDVQTPYAQLETAYFAKSGKGKPIFCILAEYDALPEMGHACGHNLICAAAIGAGKALADTLHKEKIPGTVIVMGTPAEEGKGGKVYLVRRKAFANIDAAIMAHPSSRTRIWRGFLSIIRFEVSFKGRSSHASTAPEKGRNALDAVMLFFQGINAWRQHLPESSRIHGIVKSGGNAPNIVPDFASCSFYIRAENQAILEEMEKRFRDIAHGAALMTGTTCEIKDGEEGYKSGKINKPLNDEYFKVAGELGMEPGASEKSGRASSDFGDVSQVVPGTHVYFGISPKENIPLHSAKFADAARSQHALGAMLDASKALAQIGYRFFTDFEFREEVKEDFKK
ncbi:MAG: M20 family metallopeptidase [Victivallales bacterium]